MAPFFFCLCTYSLGGESLSVVQSTFCAKWFKGNELALAFGITLSFSRIVRVLAPTLAYIHSTSIHARMRLINSRT